MANNPMPPVPFKSEMTNDDNFLSPAWSAWFRELFNRIGGSIAPTNLELSTGSTTIQTTVNTHTTQITALQSAINDLNQGPVL